MTINFGRGRYALTGRFVPWTSNIPTNTRYLWTLERETDAGLIGERGVERARVSVAFAKIDRAEFWPRIRNG